MKKSSFFVVAVLVSILVSGVTAYAVIKLSDRQNRNYEAAATSAEHRPVQQRAVSDYPDLTYAAETAVNGVVNIERLQQYGQRHQTNPLLELFGRQYQQGPQEIRSGGSGVIISADGYIVTNNHVVENASKLKVKLNDNRTFDAQLVGADPTTDIALLKIDAEGLPTLAFGDSDELRLGEWVLAIGSPFDLQSTVTAGIVSAKARRLSVIPAELGIESFIQTDAAVNPGNSGGALVNTDGELVGINSAIKTPTGSYAGYSFAVPSSIVSKVVFDLKEYGVVQRALIGVRFVEIDDAFIEQWGRQYGIAQPGGLFVSAVEPGWGAEEAGIKVGDIIIEADGIATDRSAALLEYVAKRRPNDKIRLTVKREGGVKHFDVVLRNRSGKAELVSKDTVYANDALGGTFMTVDSAYAAKLGIEGGVAVMSIKPAGILGKARVREGYIITQINGKQVRSESELAGITDRIHSIDGVYPDGKFVSYYDSRE